MQMRWSESIQKDYFSSSVRGKFQTNLITSKVKRIGFTMAQAINTIDAMKECCLLCLAKPQTNHEVWEGIKVDSGTWEELNIKTVLEKHFWSLVSINPV